mgnify:CR=1 FL=1
MFDFNAVSHCHQHMVVPLSVQILYLYYGIAITFTQILAQIHKPIRPPYSRLKSRECGGLIIQKSFPKTLHFDFIFQNTFHIKNVKIID